MIGEQVVFVSPVISYHGNDATLILFSAYNSETAQRNPFLWH